MQKIINFIAAVLIVGVLAGVYFVGGFGPDFYSKAEQCFDTKIENTGVLSALYEENPQYEGLKAVAESIKKAELCEKTSSGDTPVSWNGYWGLGGKQGNYGRLSIPSLGLSVALNYSGKENFQDIVDADDSALITDYWGGLYLADHNFQGADVITKAIPDETIMYIRNGEKVYAFICSMKDRNIYYDGDIWFADGSNAMDFSFGDAIFQTCEYTNNINCVTWWKEKR